MSSSFKSLFLLPIYIKERIERIYIDNRYISAKKDIYKGRNFLSASSATAPINPISQE
jgi:hypothetical protein